jgi:hypothetical protein
MRPAIRRSPAMVHEASGVSAHRVRRTPPQIFVVGTVTASDLPIDWPHDMMLWDSLTQRPTCPLSIS